MTTPIFCLGPEQLPGAARSQSLTGSHCVSSSAQLYSCVRPWEEDCTLSAANGPHSPLPDSRELDSTGRPLHHRLRLHSAIKLGSRSLVTALNVTGCSTLHTALYSTLSSSVMICAVIWLSDTADLCEPMKWLLGRDPAFCGCDATIFECNAAFCECNATICECNATICECDATICKSQGP